MKRAALSLGSLLCVALPLNALAQSSTATIYGLIDQGATYVDNVGGSRLNKLDDSVSPFLITTSESHP